MTIKEMLTRAVDERGDEPFIQYKEAGTWTSLSFQEVERQARVVAEICHVNGAMPGDHIALLRENSPEWPAIYFGITGCGLTAVPIDAKLQEQEVAHILRDSGASIVFTSARSYPIIRDIEDYLPRLKHVILIDEHDALPEGPGRVNYSDYKKACTQAEAAADDDDSFYRTHDPEEGDIASLIYTSGTTGRQKAAMLSHVNFTANVYSALDIIDVHYSDNFLLVLPLHHAFAFTTNLLVPLGAMCRISLVESLRTIRENMYEIEPTVLIAVPLLLEKMYNRIQDNVRKSKVARLLMWIGLSHIIGRKLRKRLGGKLKLIVSGGAPCDPDILRGWSKLGIDVIEGYGLTETAPVLTLNPPSDIRIGTVGKPMTDIKISILDPNDQGVGEIAVKGPNVMQGYYNNPEATREVFRDDWLLTGDLGFLDPDGYLIISGRKKNLIVNRSGKNIYPEEVEYQINKSPFILECLAVGYRDPDETVGERVGLIVVPNQETIDEYAAKEHRTLSDQDVEDLIRAEVKRVSREIAEYKRPRRIQIRIEEFEKTSTAKIKRYLYSMEGTPIEA